jgi:hypothetical protein
MNIPLVALTIQPDDDIAPSPLSEGDLLIGAVFIGVIVLVFGFDMMRTWWQTNAWRRDARRRRRELR